MHKDLSDNLDLTACANVSVSANEHRLLCHINNSLKTDNVTVFPKPVVSVSEGVYCKITFL